MPSIATSIVALAVLAGSVCHAAPVARAQPSGYFEGYLEPYSTYHLRYLALDCQDQHDTTFFDECCHPLLSNETLATRSTYCTPNATQISAAAVAVTASSSAAVSASSADADVKSAYAQATTSASAAPSASSVVADAAFATHTATTTTAAYVASTTTTEAAEPTTTTTKAAATTTTTKAAATTTASSGSGQTMTGGYATYFYQGGNAGECGTVHSDSDYGIAIDSNGWWSDYESNSNSPYCGKQISITNSNNGKSVTATVWDVCPTCVSSNSLDLSVAAFQAIASESDGMVPITWQWA